MTNPTPHGQVPAIQRYKIGYHADEWGHRSSTPSGIPDASGSWVRYADHVTALAAGQATAAQQGAAYAAQPSYEHQRAIMEGERNASLDAYSRVVSITSAESRLYEAGFTNGWDRRDRLAAYGQAPAPAAVAGCTRSHPHENMDNACRAKAALAEMRSKAARGAEATAHDLERFVSMLAAAPTTQPSPQKEPEAWRLVPADATDDMMAAFAKAAAADVDWHNATEADRQEVRDGFCPAYRAMLKAAPQPAPAAQGDALDAERLDWLTFNLSGKALRDIGVVWSEHGDARRAIDAARAAQEGK